MYFYNFNSTLLTNAVRLRTSQKIFDPKPLLPSSNEEGLGVVT